MSDIPSGRPRARSAPVPLTGAASNPPKEKAGRTKSGVTVTVSDPQHRPPATGPSRVKPLRERKVERLDDRLSAEETAASLKALKGKTIKPIVADRYIGRIPLNHLGQIVESDQNMPCGKPLTREDVRKLNDSVISNLSETNSPHERDAPRIETELIFHLYSRMKGEREKNGDPSRILTKCLAALKGSWLHGSVISETAGLLRFIAGALAESHPELAALAKALASEASGKKANTQYHDNVLARHFEAELVRLLVANPPGSVLRASSMIGRYISLALLDGIPNKANEQKVFENIAADLISRNRPYPIAGSLVQQFLASPNRTSFSEMMRRCNNGFDVLKVNWVCAVAKEHVNFPFVGNGMSFYRNIIRPARSSTPSVLSSGVTMTPVFLARLERELNNVADKYNLHDNIALRKCLVRVEEAREAFAAGDTEIQHHMRQLDNLNRDYRAQRKDLQRKGAPDEEFRKLAIYFDHMKRPVRIALYDEIERASSKFDKLLVEMGIGGGPLRTLAKKMRALLTEEVEIALSDIYKFERLQSLVETRVELPNEKQIKTRGFGTQLPHQRAVDYPESDEWPERLALQSYLHVDIAAPSEFEQRGLRANRHLATGVSGTIILLVNAFRHVGREAKKIGVQLNLGDAFFGSLMYLTFDGGHSFSEAYGALYAYVQYINAHIDKNPKALQNAEASLNSFVLDYQQLDMDQFGASEDVRLTVRAAMDQAFELTLAAFEKMHAERHAPPKDKN